MSEGVISDAEVAVSEISTNTLHALPHVQFRDGHAVAGMPELWMYLRHARTGSTELVGVVFDAGNGYVYNRPARRQANRNAIRGRGLQLVDELTHHRWGHHLSRSRLGPAVPGAATWFSIPAPAIPPPLFPDLTGFDAVGAIFEQLYERGVQPLSLQVTHHQTWLSARPDISIWCLNGTIRCQHQGQRIRRPITDLADVIETVISWTEATRRPTTTPTKRSPTTRRLK